MKDEKNLAKKLQTKAVHGKKLQCKICGKQFTHAQVEEYDEHCATCKTRTEADELGEKWLEGMIGEGIHTGLRKCLDSKQAMIVHRAISELTDEEWGIVARWVSGIIWEDIQAEIDRLKAELAENQALCDGCKVVETLNKVISKLKGDIKKLEVFIGDSLL